MKSLNAVVLSVLFVVSLTIAGCSGSGTSLDASLSGSEDGIVGGDNPFFDPIEGGDADDPQGPNSKPQDTDPEDPEPKFRQVEIILPGGYDELPLDSGVPYLKPELDDSVGGLTFTEYREVFDAYGGSGEIAWSVTGLPVYLTSTPMGPRKLEIAGQPTISHGGGDFRVTLTASDKKDSTNSDSYTFIIRMPDLKPMATTTTVQALDPCTVASPLKVEIEDVQAYDREGRLCSGDDGECFEYNPNLGSDIPTPNLGRKQRFTFKVTGGIPPYRWEVKSKVRDGLYCVERMDSDFDGEKESSFINSPNEDDKCEKGQTEYWTYNDSWKIEEGFGVHWGDGRSERILETETDEDGPGRGSFNGIRFIRFNADRKAADVPSSRIHLVGEYKYDGPIPTYKDKKGRDDLERGIVEDLIVRVKDRCAVEGKNPSLNKASSRLPLAGPSIALERRPSYPDQHIEDLTVKISYGNLNLEGEDNFDEGSVYHTPLELKLLFIDDFPGGDPDFIMQDDERTDIDGDGDDADDEKYVEGEDVCEARPSLYCDLRDSASGEGVLSLTHLHDFKDGRKVNIAFPTMESLDEEGVPLSKIRHIVMSLFAGWKTKAGDLVNDATKKLGDMDIHTITFESKYWKAVYSDFDYGYFDENVNGPVPFLSVLTELGGMSEGNSLGGIFRRKSMPWGEPEGL